MKLFGPLARELFINEKMLPNMGRYLGTDMCERKVEIIYVHADGYFDHS